MEGVWSILTRLMRCLPPEVAHDFAMVALRHNLVPSFFLPRQPGLTREQTLPSQSEINIFATRCRVPGDAIIRLRHPIALAAGFDKDATCLPALERCGFAALEVGTVTPKAQAGNPKPRLFRLPKEYSLINRFGFNSAGLQQFEIDLRRGLSALKWRTPVWVNIGKNKLTPNELALDDYALGLECFANDQIPITINLSSPNTVGLRDLANVNFLKELSRLSPVLSKIWIKLDPDTEKADFQALISAIAELGFGGVVLTNTHRVQYPEAGGQSGHALSLLSAQRLEWAFEVHQGQLATIASGGVLNGLDLFHRLARGADFVQIYTAFVYHGPFVIERLLRQLQAVLTQYGFASVEDLQKSARDFKGRMY